MNGLRAFSIVIVALMFLAGCNPPPAEDTSGTGGAGAGTTGFMSEGDTIKIGVNLELTGEVASFGVSCLNGIRLALEEINENGVLGKKITLIEDDNKGKGTEAASVAKKQVEVDNVPLMIGAAASTNSIAISQVAEGKGIPQVTPASTRTDLTVDKYGNVKRYVFRTCFTDDFQGDAIAKFCWDELGARRIAILYDNGQDYSKGIYQRVKETFTKLGGVVASERTYDAKVDNDFSAHLSQIKTAKFDVLVVPGYYQQVGQIAKQARGLGIEQPLVGGDGFDSPQLIEVGGDAVEDAFFTTHFSADDPSEKAQAFVSKYKSKYGLTPDAMAVLGYDAMKLCADAIERAGSADPEAITKALADTRNYPAVTGNITIDELHNAVKDIVVMKVENGKFVMHKRVEADIPEIDEASNDEEQVEETVGGDGADSDGETSDEDAASTAEGQGDTEGSE
ncbi:ABC transporter substrate-binding protein [bacterium]|nr:ABC transporter substrate-binding protein [bacterium]